MFNNNKKKTVVLGISQAIQIWNGYRSRTQVCNQGILNENNNNKKDVTPLLLFFIPKCVSGTEPQALNFFFAFSFAFLAENNGRLYKVN